MTARELLDRVAEAGGTVTLEAGTLRVLAPAGDLPADLVADLREHKTEVVELLASEVVTPLPLRDFGPSWREEVRTWPPDFQADYALLVESYRKHGDPRGVAEYRAFLDLEDGLPEPGKADR